MAETSAIEWCDATVNFWWGCTKVGPGCDNCYAEDWNNFRGNRQWGPGAPRQEIKGAESLMRKLQHGATGFFGDYGRRRRVFMQSMSDTFDNEVDDALRQRLFDSAEVSDRLNVMLLTKRVSNVEKMVPAAWREGGWPGNVGLMVTMVNQLEAVRDSIRLARLKARFGIPWIGVSIEPMLGPMALRRLRVENRLMFDALTGTFSAMGTRFHVDIPDPLPALDFVIVGGESGKNARPMHPAWAELVMRDCAATGTAFLFKQWGEWVPASDIPRGLDRRRLETIELNRDPNAFATVHLDIMTMYRAGKHRSGRLLGGSEHINFPEALR